MRRRRQLLVRFGDLEQRRATRRVVQRAVVDLVALERRVLAQVVPVRGVDDVLVLLVAPLELGDDVVRLDLPRVDLDVERCLGVQRDGLEVFPRGLCFERIEVLARRGEELLRLVERDPSFDAHSLLGVGRDDVELFLRVAAAHDAVWIAGRPRFVDDDRRRRALLRRDLVLVRPAPVVGHRAPLEHRRVERGVVGDAHGRIVDEHENRLALHVDALVVVPAVLGRDDAVADEDDAGRCRCSSPDGRGASWRCSRRGT